MTNCQMNIYIDLLRLVQLCFPPVNLMNTVMILQLCGKVNERSRGRLPIERILFRE